MKKDLTDLKKEVKDLLLQSKRSQSLSDLRQRDAERKQQAKEMTKSQSAESLVSGTSSTSTMYEKLMKGDHLPKGKDQGSDVSTLVGQSSEVSTLKEPFYDPLTEYKAEIEAAEAKMEARNAYIEQSGIQAKDLPYDPTVDRSHEAKREGGVNDSILAEEAIPQDDLKAAFNATYSKQEIDLQEGHKSLSVVLSEDLKTQISNLDKMSLYEKLNADPAILQSAEHKKKYQPKAAVVKQGNRDGSRHKMSQPTQNKPIAQQPDPKKKPVVIKTTEYSVNNVKRGPKL